MIIKPFSIKHRDLVNEITSNIAMVDEESVFLCRLNELFIQEMKVYRKRGNACPLTYALCICSATLGNFENFAEQCSN